MKTSAWRVNDFLSYDGATTAIRLLSARDKEYCDVAVTPAEHYGVHVSHVHAWRATLTRRNSASELEATESVS